MSAYNASLFFFTSWNIFSCSSSLPVVPVLDADLPLPLAVRASTAHVVLISSDGRRRLRGVLSGRRRPEAVWGVQYMSHEFEAYLRMACRGK